MFRSRGPPTAPANSTSTSGSSAFAVSRGMRGRRRDSEHEPHDVPASVPSCGRGRSNCRGRPGRSVRAPLRSAAVDTRRRGCCVMTTRPVPSPARDRRPARPLEKRSSHPDRGLRRRGQGGGFSMPRALRRSRPGRPSRRHSATSSLVPRMYVTALRGIGCAVSATACAQAARLPRRLRRRARAPAGRAAPARGSVAAAAGSARARGAPLCLRPRRRRSR